MAKKTETPASRKALAESLTQAEAEMALAEARYTTNMLNQLSMYEQTNPFLMRGEADDPNWAAVGPGGTQAQSKQLWESRDAASVRNQSYRFWRYHPQGRGILRNFVRFIIGRGFQIDFDDPQHGTWNADRTKLVVSDNPDDPLVAKEAWTEFELRNKFTDRRKEIILRTFRDGEVFIRKFVVNGRVLIRFVEPEKIDSGTQSTAGVVTVADVDATDPIMSYYIGQPTAIENGIEYIATDRETVIAYHVTAGGTNATSERVPAKDMIHRKAFADANDLRGIPLLEVVAKTLLNYEQWEHYRMVLNKVRTSIALVRKVEGTAQQARSIIEGRTPTRAAADGLTPQTASAMRESAFRAGTILTPGPGVSYDFMSPKLDARDAAEDGRRLLLSVASGVGLPEMLVTGDWSQSNYSSSVESRTPAVREWEDWQDAFDTVFTQIVAWVLDAAVESLGLPETTKRTCTLNWPILIAKDAAKETARNMNLFNGGILSRTTWSAREELVYDDELKNLRDESEDMLLAPEFAAIANQVRLNLTVGDPGAAGAITGAPAPTPIQPNEVTGAAASHPGPTIEAKNILLTSLRGLHESVDSIDDDEVKAALKQYIFGIAKIIKSG
jgi:capsid protein